MEIYELKYFLGVAQFENIHKASEKLHVSTASLSKAVARLEDELGVQLFKRERRNIVLTDHGRALQKRAAQMVELETATKIELAGQLGSLNVRIVGPEILLAKVGVEVAAKIKKKFPLAMFEFFNASEKEALNQVKQGEAHFALISGDVGRKSEFRSSPWMEAQFQTFVGKDHPLYSYAKNKKTISIEDVLKHSFVSPDNPILGAVGNKQSLDGWRDDMYPRKIAFLSSGLKMLEELVMSGMALAYLPTYYCQNLPVEYLKISGCPYTCTQSIKLVRSAQNELGWANQIF